MAYQVLARRYRPQSFADVIGQEHVTRVLEGAITAGRVAHGYLFCGPRGVGKTSVARILAKALNCDQGPTPTPCNICTSCVEITAGRSLDVLEIDGASSGGIDQVRELRENARYAPSGGRTKLYIIDEVHQVTTHGFNALLKTLEEPPPHVVFVLATTEPQKVPDTVMSRVQRFDFRRLAARDIEVQLRKIVEQESFPVDPGAIKVLSHRAQGSMRDAEVLLDQVVATAEGTALNRQAVERLLGLTGLETYLALTERLSVRDAAGALALLDRVLAQGANQGELIQGLIEHLRTLLLLAVSPDLAAVTELTDDAVTRCREQLAQSGWSRGDLSRLLSMALGAAAQMRLSELPRLHLELVLVEMAELKTTADLRTLVDRLEALGADDSTKGSDEMGGPSEASSGSGKSPARGGSGRPRKMAGNEIDPPVEASATRAVAEPAVAAPAITGPAVDAPVITGPAVAAPVAGAVAEVVARAVAGAVADAVAQEPHGIETWWGRVVERVTARKAFLGRVLAEASRVGVEEGVLRLDFAPSQSFHRQSVLDSRNLTIVGEEVRRERGQGLPIEVRQDQAPAERPVGTRGTEPRSGNEERAAPQMSTENPAPRVPARGSPGVEKVVELFDGVILD